MAWRLGGIGLRRYEIAERSMEPGLRPGDYVVAVAPRRPPRRGEIVILTHPADPDLELVKRVVGLSGETLKIHDGRVTIDGAPGADPWGRGPTMPDGTWLIPAAHVFVLGDNRVPSTADSRSLGPVEVPSLGWRVVFRYGRRSGGGPIRRRSRA